LTVRLRRQTPGRAGYGGAEGLKVNKAKGFSRGVYTTRRSTRAAAAALEAYGVDPFG